MAKLVFKDIEEFKKMEGKELPIGDWLTVTQEMINAFAAATLDFQWIHTDVEKAKKHSPFKEPVAHGFLSVSLISKLLADLFQVKSATMGINYGLNKVRFPHPVLVESRVRLKAKVVEIEPYKDTGIKIIWESTVEIEGASKPACTAEFISLMFE